MLDQLGLGIVLTLQDNFTPQANKAVQSMDRFTSSAEKMEKDVQESMNNLQTIMLAGFSLNQVGGDFDRAGKKILGTIKDIYRGVVGINASFQTQQKQLLTAFKGDANEAKKAFDWVREFASDTPYEIRGLGDAFMKLKTSGIDMRDSFKMANGELKTLAEAVGDLATRNMSSTGGVSGMGYALQEAWAGQYRSLVNRFNIARADMSGMIQYAGKDSQKFVEEFIKLSQKYAPDAMRNVQGTWEQVVSNMQDSWENFIYEIGEAGVFQPMLNTLTKVRAIFDKTVANKDTIKNIANVLTDFWKPIDKIIIGLTNITAKVTEFLGAHPMLAKFILGLGAFAGVTLVLSGTVMKLVGSFLILSTSLVSAYANLVVLDTFTKVNLFSGLGAKVGALVRGLGILGLIAGVFAIGFMNNTDGIRDKWDLLTKQWDNSGKALKAGLGDGLESLKSKHGIVIDDMTKKLMQFRMITTILFKTLFGKTVNGYLQYTEKELQNIRVLGLMPLAQTMAMIRGRVKSFAQGLWEGLTSAYKVAKNFLDFALAPIKAIFEYLSNLAPIKAISSLFGVKKEAGIGTGEASGQLEQFKDTGRIAGGLLGTLIGFKVVKTITSAIVSPFKTLFSVLNKTKEASEGLRSSLGRISVGSIMSSGAGFKATFNNRLAKAKSHFNEYLGERTELPNTSASAIRGYDRVNYTDVPERFRDYILGEGADPYNLYTKKTSKLGQALLGAKYYNVGQGGAMNYVGRFGGRMSQEYDDTQLKLATQMKGVNPPTLSDLNSVYGGNTSQLKFDMRRFIKQDKKVGGMVDLAGSFDNKYYNSIKSDREDYMQSMMSNPAWRSNAYKAEGIDGRVFNSDPKARESFLKRSLFSDPKVQIASSWMEGVRNKSLDDSPVYQAKSSKLSQLLFGQRMYVPDVDSKGRYFERTVARRGGIFRDPAKDMVYNDEGDVSLRGRMSKMFGGTIGGARNILGIMGRGMRSGAQGMLGGMMKPVNMFKESKVGGFLGKVAQAPLNFVNNQLERLGYSPLGGLFDKKDEEGNVVSQGLFSKAGAFLKEGGGGKAGKLLAGIGKGAGTGLKFAGKVAGGVGRGVSALGRGLVGSLPLMVGAFSVGKMGFDAIKAQGDGDFGKGVEVLKEKISKMDFVQVFKNFTEGFKKNIKLFAPLAKEVFSQIAKSIKPIMGMAWEGIKAGAGLAWQFIKDHGLDILKGFTKVAVNVLGFLWEGLKKGAVLVWNWLVESGIPMIGKLVGNIVGWIISDGIPLLIKGVFGFWKWLTFTAIPALLKMFANLAVSIGKGLLNGLVGALKGLGKALGNAMLGALKGVIKLLLPKPVEGVVLQALGLVDVPEHHGGLWLSEDEHQAVIKRDETVLPPDKSRKLDAFLERPNKQEKPQQVDNSITIEKVEVVVQADKLSRTEARKQALMILEEFKKLNKESRIRAYSTP